MFWGFIRSTFTYILLGIVIVFLGIPCFLMLLLPARWRYDNKLFFWLSHVFYVAALKASMLPITFIGKENIPNEPVIIAANHQSALDIPLVGSLLNGFPHIWFATTWLLKSAPALAPILRRMAVLVDMSTPQAGLRSLMKAIELIKGKRRHAVVFPEGGRDIQGNRVREFFAGFAMLAKHTNRPVVPVMIFDAYKVYPPGAYIARRHPVKVVVGKPMYMKESEEVADFKDRVYQWFVQQVESEK